jgi:hypothetical protein
MTEAQPTPEITTIAELLSDGRYYPIMSTSGRITQSNIVSMTISELAEEPGERGELLDHSQARYFRAAFITSRVLEDQDRIPRSAIGYIESIGREQTMRVIMADGFGYIKNLTAAAILANESESQQAQEA